MKVGGDRMVGAACHLRYETATYVCCQQELGEVVAQPLEGVLVQVGSGPNRDEVLVQAPPLELVFAELA